MEEVNCTEAISMATWSRAAGLVKTQTVSVLLLLRAQPGTLSGAGQEHSEFMTSVFNLNCLSDMDPDACSSPADSRSHGELTDLQFEEEGAAWPGKSRVSTPEQASQTVRILCSLASKPQLVGLNDTGSSQPLTVFICKEYFT